MRVTRFSGTKFSYSNKFKWNNMLRLPRFINLMNSCKIIGFYEPLSKFKMALILGTIKVMLLMA